MRKVPLGVGTKVASRAQSWADRPLERKKRKAGLEERIKGSCKPSEGSLGPAPHFQASSCMSLASFVSQCIDCDHSQ